MVRMASVVASVLLVVLAACESGGDAPPLMTDSPSFQNETTIVPVTPVPKPASVPEAAGTIDRSTTLGRITRRANAPAQGVATRTLQAVSCQADVMTIQTSEETVYAAMPCDRFWDAETIDLFSGEEVAIAIVVTDVRFQIFIETLPGAQAEFTVEGVWVE